ncbi:hypothetical protein KKC_12295 [Listeria fleischmannii subsp. coloradonensis]|uniref:hypothetical protein n=1 Tax=Listeria fleischmannii TaxID=1069827 RepID=UPI000254F67C|nr:hypothetical protein [Listeria fleischmannii]EIA19457.1 hypothetical protein KKC_12295 [Listeria fleischmannii subsp. coloradonensis]
MITEVKSCEALITEMMEEAKQISKQLSVEYVAPRRPLYLLSESRRRCGPTKATLFT